MNVYWKAEESVHFFGVDFNFLFHRYLHGLAICLLWEWALKYNYSYIILKLVISTHATVNKYSIPRLIYLMDSWTPESSICSPGLTNDQFSKSHFNLRVYLADGVSF